MIDREASMIMLYKLPHTALLRVLEETQRPKEIIKGEQE